MCELLAFRIIYRCFYLKEVTEPLYFVNVDSDCALKEHVSGFFYNNVDREGPGQYILESVRFVNGHSKIIGPLRVGLVGTNVEDQLGLADLFSKLQTPICRFEVGVDLFKLPWLLPG